MTGQVNHIVSKCRWENSFDQKEKATELQQRISSWSNRKMQKEMAIIFDRICPASQTWSIQSMTLDLGHIDYDNLEEDLSLKLYSQLSDKLIEMIIYAEKQGQNIKLLHTDSSKLSMLKHYFLAGTMPWNYKSTDNSVNKMMTIQFKNNKEKIIEMLQQVGEVHENIRKRIAWQIDEANILKIIEGLETSNHNQIIKFSEELTQIQEQEKLVPANKNDFKRNLWFWILNYLFIDRGTIFNKVAFMKSSINQMSNHYNVAYFELLSMIEMAINHINVNSSTKSDFILILKILTKENESINTKNNLEIVTKPDYWLLLTDLFNSASLRKENTKKIAFNELVMALSKENKSKFRDLFSSLETATHFWTPVVHDLNSKALESIFHAVLPVKSEMIIESIYFIDKLCAEMNFKIEHNALWQIGIRFLLSHKNSPFDNKVFLNYTINELSKKNNELRENVLNQLTSVKIPASTKTIATLEIYSNLTAILSDDLSEKKNTFYVPHFTDLLVALTLQIKAKETDGGHSIITQKAIIKYIRLDPSKALDVLIQYKDKKFLKKLFPYILNKHHADLLIKKSNKPKGHLLQTLYRIIAEISNNTSGNAALPIQENLYIIGVQLMVSHPEYSSLNFLEVLLEKMALLLTSSQKVFFDLFLETLFNHKKIINTAFSASDLVKIKNKLVLHNLQASVEKIKQSSLPLLIETITQEKRNTIMINGYTMVKNTLYEYIEQCITYESIKITQNNQVFKLKELLQVALETSPEELRKILSQITITDGRIYLLKSTVDWRNFSLWIANDGSSSLQEAIETLRSLYDFIRHFMGTKNRAIWQKDFWKQTWEIIQQNKSIESIRKSFIKHWLDEIFTKEETNSNVVIATIKNNKIGISQTLKNILMEYTPAFSAIMSKASSTVNDEIIQCEKAGLLQELYFSLIILRKIPVWYKNTQNADVAAYFKNC
jgi:Contractile injection system tape measure protein